MLLAEFTRQMDNLAPRLTKTQLVGGKAWEYHHAASGNYVLFMQGLGEESKTVITIVADPPCMTRVGLSYDKNYIVVTGKQGLHTTEVASVAVKYEVRFNRQVRGRDFLTIYPEGLSDTVVRDVLVAIAGALQA
jgi:hypothetical protein